MARAVHELVSVDGHVSVALRDLFPENIKDIDFYARLGREKDLVVISKDVAQAKRKPERMAILRSGVIAMYLAPAVEKMPPVQQTATMLWHWDAIVRQRKSLENGLFLLPQNKGARFRSL